MSIVALESVHKVYPLGRTEVKAVNGVTFSIERGDFISIAGPSGSGKSTILNLIGCIDTPTSGRVLIDGNETGGLTDREITALRHRFIGFIFQSFNLVPVLNVFENIEFPLLLGKETANRKDRADYVDFLIEAVGLTQWRDHRPNELSGGQRQRVAIARALVTKPQVVLADEPTANLDSKTGNAIIELMKRINRDLSTTFIFSTHDPSIVDIADHVIRLHDGVITEDRRTREAVHSVAAGK
ncbi:MAG: ABC transporter ATP-binding protein [Spirochaetaceae bacterium]|nr:MAG: ABC transporter ATP-binding protein [Spirochaetaceae bacterium]